MYLRAALAIVFMCSAQAQTVGTVFKIAPVKASIALEKQPVEITVWGTLSPMPSGTFSVALTADLGDFQDHLTPVLAAKMYRSDRCGERLSVERASIAPAAPSSVLTANVNYERYACVKALGKQIAKRLVGGHGVIEVNLTPSLEENDIALSAQVRKVDADGSLGEVLRSGSVGDSIREKIATSVESAIQKLTNLKSMLPAEMSDAVAIESFQFADGGAGRLWLSISGEVRLSTEQVQALTKQLAQ